MVPEPDWKNLENWDRTFAQMWKLNFGPELQRRKDLGTIDDGFYLYIAQFLQPPEGPNAILFNEEVKGTAILRASRGINEGDPVLHSDLSGLEAFDLPDEFLDCGHFTIIRVKDRWLMTFNFLSGRAKAQGLFELALQFLEASETSASKGHAGPSIDNLFGACELVSKAELILHQHNAVKHKSHSSLSSAIHKWSKLENIDAAFVGLFNRLLEMRPNARYGDRQSGRPIPEAENFELVRSVIEMGFDKVSKSTDKIQK